MKPGSVLVDISIDQGGCFEDSRPTTHDDPTYRVHNSMFYCVANMPGAVPHTSTYALTNVTLPYAVELANRGWRDALRGGRQPGEGPQHASTARSPTARSPRRTACRTPRSPRCFPEHVTVRVPAGAPPDGAAGPLRAAVRGYLAHLQVERGLAVNTLGAYRRDLDRYLQHLESLGLRAPDEVREEHVSAFLAAIRTGEDGGSPLVATSAARAVVAVRGFHRFLHLEGTAADDPAGQVRPPATPQRLPKAMAVADVERLLEAAPARTPRSPGLRDRALLEVLYGSGARISEAVGLDVDDLDLPPTDASLVRLRGKGGKERIVPLGSYAVACARRVPGAAAAGAWRRGRGGPALFLNTRGGRLSRQSAWAVLQGAARRAGLEDAASRRTRCGTRSRPTCSRAAPTCASSRNCWGTHR